MKQLLPLFLFVLIVSNAKGQFQSVDSLINVLNVRKLNNEEKIDIYEKISKYYVNNDLEKGIRYSKDGLSLAEKESNSKLIATFNKYLGIAYYSKSSYDSSSYYLNKSLEYAVVANDKQQQMAAYGSLGNLYNIQQNYSKAIEYYEKVLEVNYDKENPTVIYTLINIGTIHRALNNLDKSVDFFQQAIKLSENIEHIETKMSANYGLGVTYSDKNDFKKSEKYFMLSLKYSRDYNNKPFEIRSLISLASLYCGEGDYKMALKYADEGKHISEVYNAPQQQLATWITFADIYREMKRYDECEEVAIKAWDIDSISLNEGANTAIIRAIANIHLGNKDKAEYFIRKYREIIQTGNEKSLHNSLIEMEVKYETEKKEMRIASLEKEHQLYVWLGIAGVLFALSFGVALWLKIRNSQKEKQLVASNAVQEGEMGERERIAGELHDRLLGSLSAVKSEIDNTDLGNKLNGCIEEVRRISRDLMPLPLRNGIKTALEDFSAQFPNVRFRFFGQEKRIEKRLEFVLYCCANELVTNSIRHSGAKKINVQLVQGENHIALTVQDDGSGFDEKTVTKGVGLRSVQDRVASCNGKMNVFSSTDKGTETVIAINI